jgi:CRISPR-associated endonuclease/helicase Cas3
MTPSVIAGRSMKTEADSNCSSDRLRDRTDRELHQYVNTHFGAVSGLPSAERIPSSCRVPPVFYRIALSCLVDADHTDTARHYGREAGTAALDLLPAERLKYLDRYVAALPRQKNDQRSDLRQRVYEECKRQDPTRSAIWECDSPVGTGKTTAVMAHLLRAAEEKSLRRVFVVLPFTNVIDQAVGVYRKSLILPGEDWEQVVAAHHHKADYEQTESRHLSVLWRSPVVVTTAVQFFETLAASSTASLRKLHEVVGSAVFIDEAHAALPAKLWPQAWDWICRLAADWGCHFVLGSGSLNRVWTIRECASELQPKVVPPLVESEVRTEAADGEKRRVEIKSRPRPMTLNQFAEWLSEQEGPRIVVVNTVQIAAALAQTLSERQERGAVMHLSTALTPHHRALILELVKTRLAYASDLNWTLVATSCVEAGVDFSFRTGFRQRASLASLLQLCGRVSRNGEYPGAAVWDFELILGGLVNENRLLRDAADALAPLFAQNRVSAEHCTEALANEIALGRRADLHRELRKAENARKFPDVEKLFRVIDADTRTVVVSRTLQESLRRGEPVNWRELQKHSVQIYADSVAKLGLYPARSMHGVYFWDLPYDDFLGYMAGALPLQKGRAEGGFLY